MLNRSNFITVIDALKQNEDFFTDLSAVCRNHNVDNGFIDTCVDLKLQDVIVDILCDAMNDVDEFIPWWLYDCRFGTEHAYITVKEDNGDVKYNLNTAEDLYNFLAKYYG